MAKFSMITEILLKVPQMRNKGKIVTDASVAEAFDEFYSQSDVLATLKLADDLGLIEHEGETSAIKPDEDALRKYLAFIEEWESVRKTVVNR